MNARVLVLNTSFEPINVCTERRAVVMIFKGVARMEEHNGHMLHSAKLAIHAPSVIRLTEYIHIPFERRSLSRKNILLRDHSTCQYCGKQLRLRVDPRSRKPRSRGGIHLGQPGGPVASGCNHRRAVARGGIRDASGAPATRFSLHVNARSCVPGTADETWRKYLFMNQTPASDLCVRDDFRF